MLVSGWTHRFRTCKVSKLFLRKFFKISHWNKTPNILKLGGSFFFCFPKVKQNIEHRLLQV